MRRNDICPVCGKELRWIEPTESMEGQWKCPRCKYKRHEGAPKADWLQKYWRKRRNEKRKREAT